MTKSEAYGSLALDKRLSASNLSALDKRLVSNIVYGTLENLLRIDYAIKTFLERPDEVDDAAMNILRLSAYQMMFLDKIPHSAAVNEAVNLARQVGLDPLSGFINGVLRNLSRGIDDIAWPDKEAAPLTYLSIMYSIPGWLVERLVSAYGFAQAEAICAYRDREGGIPLRPNTLQYSTDEAFEALLGKKVWQARPGKLSHVWRVTGAVDIAKDSDYRAGAFSIQGESSIMAAMAMEARRGMQILDCCAAPGGKTAYMAEAMGGTGRVQAWDKHEHRVALLQATAKRLRLENIKPMIRDAGKHREELNETFDAVLLDAPCSGLGVMLDKPDVKYRHSPATIEALVAEQKALLEANSRYVKVGGYLVYSTCSLLPEENENQVQNFLEAHPEFEHVSLPSVIPEAFRAHEGPYGLQLFPHRDGVEGFFIARLGRKGR